MEETPVQRGPRPQTPGAQGQDSRSQGLRRPGPSTEDPFAALTRLPAGAAPRAGVGAPWTARQHQTQKPSSHRLTPGSGVPHPPGQGEGPAPHSTGPCSPAAAADEKRQTERGSSRFYFPRVRQPARRCAVRAICAQEPARLRFRRKPFQTQLWPASAWTGQPIVCRCRPAAATPASVWIRALGRGSGGRDTGASGRQRPATPASVAAPPPAQVPVQSGSSSRHRSARRAHGTHGAGRARVPRGPEPRQQVGPRLAGRRGAQGGLEPTQRTPTPRPVWGPGCRRPLPSSGWDEDVASPHDALPVPPDARGVAADAELSTRAPHAGCSRRPRRTPRRRAVPPGKEAAVAWRT